MRVGVTKKKMYARYSLETSSMVLKLVWLQIDLLSVLQKMKFKYQIHFVGKQLFKLEAYRSEREEISWSTSTWT